MKNHGLLIFLATSTFSAAFVATPGYAKGYPTSAKGDQFYQLKLGDTLSELSEKYLVGNNAVAEVQHLNRIANPDLVLAGAALRIPRALLRDEKTAASVETFSGPVVIIVGNQPVATKLGFSLSENATIQTGRNAFVTLRLSDGTALSVPSQSEVRIARMRRILLTGTVERDINVLNGRVHAQVTPMHDPNSTFRVSTPITVSAVRGTDFAIAYDAGMKRSATVVEEGKVAVTRAGAGHAATRAPMSNVMLLPGFGAASGTLDNTGAVKLLPEPGLVDPGQVQTGEQLQFSLTPEAGAVAYHLQIAKDAGGLDLIAEDSSTGLSFTLPSVPAGAYFVRAFAIDNNGLEGLPATYGFERSRNSISAAMTQSGSGKLVKYLFKWTATTDGAPAIRFRLVRQSSAQGAALTSAPAAIPVVDELNLKTNSLEIGNLPNGDYKWQVSSTLVVGGKVIETWSPEQSFHIVGRN